MLKIVFTSFGKRFLRLSPKPFRYQRKPQSFFNHPCSKGVARWEGACQGGGKTPREAPTDGFLVPFR
jgi:hypothetical protein